MRLCDLQKKEVINICDGKCLGNVIDIDLDENTGCICALIIPGPCKIFGMFGHEFEYCIPWKCIVRIGSDIILVEIQENNVKNKL
ncbi:MAG: YlmC/YmxH family sporulation protein [Lachnospiraceae bacterium]|nr:YlmC/YmxH family sporulation protein [Lachnospiraceae bacterium]